MKLYPAIDLRGGQAVRLYQGDYDQMTVYNADPVAQAQAFLDAGARYLHVVDLDGAKDDTTANLETIAAIAALGGLFIEVGGGIRDEARIRRYLDLGVGRCILGTVAVKDFGFTARMAQRYGARIAVGVDMKDGFVAVNGWREVTPEPGVAFCRRCAAAGVRAVIATDISRDGTLQGTNLDLYRELLTIPGLEITASGGIARMEELAELQAMGCHAAILGKSIYTGAIDLAEAVRRYQEG
ncbi:MAG TPA: 1-(5-phosphoribosyl)-5-[(5-phosphoribosylamino)methylideneamino]imidazole-4-carboxamide isomerase [Candidatus Gemmiger excrementipullorum]|uniref:1-(5-phosphoribosyl)-5-[(5-phosphoribosylamino)methylideneamino] imidazole-4-carboxamide isomerase n=1 Tax=Candidatus Gemmiger excrementipullorum TaxID=2838610 RepID=A0A9D2BUT1_9FIRM|nr:1-(5-phosphoribosyl)-5-[(5-phosphoribosylamino)methylideneamino]imidazole-4-carboxamide isomerase [Candidatus Gemmiger excrementipullorum]